VFDAATDRGEALQEYLNHAIRVVQRERIAGIAQSAILDAFDAGQEVLRPEDRMDLAQRLEHARNQIVRKVRAYESTRPFVRNVFAETYVEGNAVEHNEQIITGGTFTGNVINKVAAARIDRSFDTVVQSEANADLKSALTLLADEVKALVRDMEDAQRPTGDIEDVASLLETFTAQAVEKRPLAGILQAAGRGIVDAANVISERAQPIAAAVASVLSLLKVAGIT
jgi:hypothetical protein